MSDIVQAIIKRSSVFIIITGVILLIVGAAGDITFGSFVLRLSNQITQWVIIVVGGILVFVGIYFEAKGNNLSIAEETDAKFGLFTSDKDTFSNFKVEKGIETAQSIELLGYNLKSLLQEIRVPLANAIIRGASVRIILVDITSKSVQDTFQNHSNRPHLVIPEWVTGLEHIKDIRELLASAPKINGKFEVKVTTWIPSSNLIIFNADNENGTMKVGIHTVIFRQPLSGRLSLVLHKKDNPTAFEYFTKGFETLWSKDSVDWNGVIPTIAQES
jgi:hypothetical protein